VAGELPSAENTPYLGETRNATVTILANDDTYGAFTVYSDSPLASDGGHVIQVEEKENLAVELVVERQGLFMFVEVTILFLPVCYEY
jgi:hypothetical protein